MQEPNRPHNSLPSSMSRLEIPHTKIVSLQSHSTCPSHCFSVARTGTTLTTLDRVSLVKKQLPSNQVLLSTSARRRIRGRARSHRTCFGKIIFMEIKSREWHSLPINGSCHTSVHSLAQRVDLLATPQLSSYGKGIYITWPHFFTSATPLEAT